MEPDSLVSVTGAVGLRRGNLEIVNPYYTLAPAAEPPAPARSRRGKS